MASADWVGSLSTSWAVQPVIRAQRVHLGEPLVAFPLLRSVGQVPTVTTGPSLAAGSGELLDLRRPWLADSLVAVQRRLYCPILRLAQAAGQDHRILNRLSGSLGEELEHGMRGVAQQDDAAGTPALERLAIIERPASGLTNLGDELTHLLVPVREFGGKVLNASRRRPRLFSLVASRHGPDEVDQPPGGDRVVYEVSFRPHPQGHHRPPR